MTELNACVQYHLQQHSVLKHPMDTVPPNWQFYKCDLAKKCCIFQQTIIPKIEINFDDYDYEVKKR